MKKLLWLGAAVALTGFAADAYGQVYEKGDASARVMGEMERTDVPRMEDRRPATRSVTKQDAQRAARMEPAAGARQQQNRFADFRGFYLGGDVGYNMGSYEADVLNVTDGDVGIDGFEAGLFAGYGFSHNFMTWLGGYGGVEVGYAWTEQDGSIGATEFEKNQNILVTFRPGITMNQDTLGYGIIGWSYAEFEANGSEDDLNGLVLGAGAEFDTQTPLKMRLEYTYTNYEDTDLGTTGFDGHENNVKLGAVFRF